MAKTEKTICVCPLLDKECFSKRGHRGVCYFLTEPAIHIINGKTDCAFRKVHRDKPRGWRPANEAERKWSYRDKQRTLYS